MSSISDHSNMMDFYVCDFPKPDMQSNFGMRLQS